VPTENSGKNSKGQFTKGNKLGTGRPKHITTIIREMSNDYKDYLVMLDDWARDTSVPRKDRIMCIKELLDRGAGKPAQYIQTEDVSPDPIKFQLIQNKDA
jgi:hypothetical protein